MANFPNLSAAALAGGQQAKGSIKLNVKVQYTQPRATSTKGSALDPVAAEAAVAPGAHPALGNQNVY